MREVDLPRTRDFGGNFRGITSANRVARGDS